jgi:SAM-dependent methyltransferase
MVEASDVFYEGAYQNQTKLMPKTERFWHTWPLWFINSGYVWDVRKEVPANSTVVELGCAGGVRYFGKRYRMVGCDISYSALENLPFYELRIMCDASKCIPVVDNSVDAIVSSYFWEHISPDMKPMILKECKRILKPGGKMIFLYDVETRNPLIDIFRKNDPNLYKRLFVENDNHLGYQTSSENIAIFMNAGFRLITHMGLEKTWVQSISVYIKLTDFKGGRIFSFLSKIGGTPLFYLWTAFNRLVDTIICPFLPRSWSRIDKIVLESES